MSARFVTASVDPARSRGGRPVRRGRPVVLVSHGSADRRAASEISRLAAAVGATPSYLDHAGPRPADVLFALERAGHGSAVLVPLLLTSAYHGRVDIPAVVTGARADGLRLDVTTSDVLGPVGGTVPGELVDGLRSLLPAGRADALVLGAAGTRDAAARATVDLVAGRLAAVLGVPCVTAYASAAGPTPGEAVAELRAGGARRVVMASYFVAPGRLHDAASASALAAGAVAVSPALSAARDLARLVDRRVAETTVLTAAA